MVCKRIGCCALWFKWSTSYSFVLWDQVVGHQLFFHRSHLRREPLGINGNFELDLILEDQKNSRIWKRWWKLNKLLQHDPELNLWFRRLNKSFNKQGFPRRLAWDEIWMPPFSYVIHYAPSLNITPPFPYTFLHYTPSLHTTPPFGYTILHYSPSLIIMPSIS